MGISKYFVVIRVFISVYTEIKTVQWTEFTAYGIIRGLNCIPEWWRIYDQILLQRQENTYLSISTFIFNSIKDRQKWGVSEEEE